MARLLVRTTLAHFCEAEVGEDADDLSRFEDRQLRQTLTYSNELCANELRFDLRLSVFEKHRQDLAKIGIQLVK